jgi:hypothetical protein
MAFDTLSDRLRLVANSSLALCRTNWGGNGLKKEQPIHDNIGWTPTFLLKPSRVLMIAVEVNDLLFPEVLKIAAHDIARYDLPISVYQACSLDVFQGDKRLLRTNLLREHGFGLITVDDNAHPNIQFRAEPLAQHISSATFDGEIRNFTLRLKVRFRSAYATYQTNVGQGLQDAGQIIEGLVQCICEQAESAGIVAPNTCKKTTAGIIDELYPATVFHNHRAALGGARHFARTYRNSASHPARNAAQAAERIRRCKQGFIDALRIATELRDVIQALGYRVYIL